MEIEFDRQPIWNAEKECVQDLVFVDGRLRPWWVSPTALDDLVESTDDLDSNDYLAIHARLRRVIEPVAATKFARGELDGAGVMVSTNDLEAEHGRHGRHYKVAPGGWVDPRTGRVG